MSTILRTLPMVIPAFRRLAEERTALQTRIAELQLELGQLRQQAAGREQQIAGIARQRDQLTLQLEQCEERSRAIATELDQLKERVSRYQTHKDIEPWAPGHFYSPLVDAEDTHVRKATEAEAHPMIAAQTIGLDEQEMLRWFAIIKRHYDSQPFPERPSARTRYYYANPNFPLADALALLGIMRETTPRHYVEVGCGYSTCAAIDINEGHLDGRAKMIFIDPDPSMVLQLIGAETRYRDSMARVKLQDAPLDFFTQLAAGDILFIDSSHVAKTGSDVVDYLFRIFPTLRPGVLIHIHDIFYPFEYPKAWIDEHKRSWNEAYFVRAFLQFNRNFRVIYFSDWIYKCHRDLLATTMPLCVQHRGGSLWIEKCT